MRLKIEQIMPNKIYHSVKMLQGKYQIKGVAFYLSIAPDRFNISIIK